MRHRSLKQPSTASLIYTALTVLLLTSASIAILWHIGSQGLDGRDLVNTRFEAVKIGLSLGAGSGGVVALYLAWRKQRSTEADLDNRERTLLHQQLVAEDNKDHQSRVAEDARTDAEARRITELFTRAAEQVGSAHLTVRLAGFYALERLGQENLSQRSSVRKLLCAYLRMPLASPEDGADGDAVNPTIDYRIAQEREVRLTVQQILLDHLNPLDPANFWPDQNLDLARATLIDFDLSKRRIAVANFKDAIFVGRRALFTEAHFSEAADFSGARFEGSADFRNVTFTDDVKFIASQFLDLADFDRASFHGDADFDRATFERAVYFRSHFHGVSYLRSIFNSSAIFGRKHYDFAAAFDAKAHFESSWSPAIFAGECNFSGVKFAVPTSFRGTRFSRLPDFTESENFFDIPEMSRMQSIGSNA